MTRPVRGLLADATERLTAAGVPSPRVDAELLLAGLLSVDRARLLTRDAVPAFVAGEYEQQVTRRIAREPLQHITGEAPFRHIVLAVGPGVFVPRPETELLVDAVLGHLQGIGEPIAVDLCAGSGALALAIADEVPGSRVVAVEYAFGAMRWLNRNVAGTAVRVVNGDVRDPELLRELYGTADAVVSNPPYVPLSADVDPEVLADPRDAVFAGPDGDELLPVIVSRAALLLHSGGLVAIEHDDSHGEIAPALVRADGRFCDIVDHPDLTGRPRLVTARRA
jgi:release factor glutamine methyltransferase